jgi:hypothetical protein
MSLNAQGTLSADHRPAHLYQKTTNSAIAETAFMAGTQTLSRGNMAYGYIHYPSSYQGYWKWDVDAIISSKTLITSSMPIMYGGEFFEGVFYCYSDYATCTFYQIDAFTGAVINSIPRPEYSAAPVNALSYDYSTNTMYALYQNGLYTVDLNTGLLSSVANISLSGGDALIMAINLDGDMFMVNIGTANFYSIDKSTGASTLIGSTGRTIGYAQCMSFDHNDGTLYWAESEAVDDNWMTINPATGVATMKTPSAYEITGLHFAFDNGGGPTYCPAVTNVAAEQVAGTCAKITWTAPSVTTDLTGYKIYEGTTELGEVAVGVTEFITGSLSAGAHTFDVEAIYDDDCTPKKVSATVTIKTCGNEITGVAVDYSTDCKATVTWDAAAKMRLGDVLVDNAIMVTHPGAGPGGADLSTLNPGENIVGTGFEHNSNFWMADQFTLTDAADITEIEFYGIQQGSNTSHVFSQVYVELYDGAPNAGGTKIFGDGSTNRLLLSEFSGIYRSYSGGNIPIMKIIADVSISLNAGTYWVAVSAQGHPSLSYCYANPVTELGVLGHGTGLKNQPGYTTGWEAWLDEDGTWAPLSLPFIVYGEDGGEAPDPKYNVYKDGVKVASEIEETTWTDTDAVAEGVDVEWCVTQVCPGDGESAAGCVTEKCGDPIEDPCDEVTGAVAEIVEECTKVVIT